MFQRKTPLRIKVLNEKFKFEGSKTEYLSNYYDFKFTFELRMKEATEKHTKKMYDKCVFPPTLLRKVQNE